MIVTYIFTKKVTKIMDIYLVPCVCSVLPPGCIHQSLYLILQCHHVVPLKLVHQTSLVKVLTIDPVVVGRYGAVANAKAAKVQEKLVGVILILLVDL